MDRSERSERRMFYLAAAWNFAVGLLLWIPPLFDPGIFGLFGMEPPPNYFHFNATMGIVIAFGVGYLLVARDPSSNHALVVTGAIAKLVIFLDAVVIFSRQEANAAILPFGVVDLVFAVLFVRFLLRERRRPAPA